MEYGIKNSGFTLVELVIVLVLLVIIAVVTVIKWPSKSIELEVLAYQVAGDIRYTQTLSMSHNERYRINFTYNNYSIADSNGVAVKHPAAKSTLILLGNGIIFNSPPTPNCIAFDGKGAPCDCSSGSMLSNEIVQLAAGSATKNIIITEITGYVSTGS
jgi:prepilin-type N-terminal cleavage/methylation domain-containing protein